MLEVHSNGHCGLGYIVSLSSGRYFVRGYSENHIRPQSRWSPAVFRSTALLFQGAFLNSAIRPSVCPVAQLPIAIGTLAACSLAIAGYQRCADWDPSADGRRSAAIFATVELL